MGAPTAEEFVVLAKFREILKTQDVKLNERQSTDMNLLRWLRARELNIPKATDMLKKSLQWRQDENLDEILTWSPPDYYSTVFPYELCGNCKDGSPVLVIPFGNWDIRTEVEGGGKLNWLRQIDQMFGFTFEEMYKTNDNARYQGSTLRLEVTNCVIVVDFTGFGIRQLTSLQSQRTILECVARFESNYPEILKAVYFINAPWAFSIFFSLIKPVLAARTLGKMEIFTSNPNKWSPALQTHIEAEQLPVHLGGTKLDCCKFFEKDYSFAAAPKSNSIAAAAAGIGGNSGGGTDEFEFITSTVPAGQELRLEYAIEKPGTILRWTFKTDSHSIGFSVEFNDSNAETDTETRVPYRKCDSHKSAEEGSLTCLESGKYTLIFDNKYSQFRSKTIHYLIRVSDEDNDEG